MLVSERFYKFVVPSWLHSDQGYNLESSLIQQLCSLYGIVKSCTTLYHPEGNGHSTTYCVHCLSPKRGTGTHFCLRSFTVITRLPIRQLESLLFFLMFGQEPWLPLDFLMGRVESPVNGSVHEWVQEHQAWLQVAFEGARECLQQAAGHRKRAHDQHVKDLPLREGQLIFLQDFSARGPHKTRDRWSSVRYQVLRAPAESGLVYTIMPVDHLTKVRQVHRKMLKAVVRADPSGCASSHNPPPVEEPPAENECSLIMICWSLGNNPWWPLWPGPLQAQLLWLTLLPKCQSCHLIPTPRCVSLGSKHSGELNCPSSQRSWS